MRNLIQAAVVTLLASSAAQAQQALQWRVQDGGNGHWYAFDSTPTSWLGARTVALGVGGDLASLSSAAERAFWMSRIPIGAGLPGCPGCTWLGGFQDRSAPDYVEPSGGWRWSDGTPWNYAAWNSGEPNDQNGQDYLYGSGPTGGLWDDSSGVCCAPFVIEWSVDCNGDGIVDHGQVLQGRLPDANSNGIPDGCECATVPTLPACCVGNLDQDSAVDGADLGALLNSWGSCPGTCPADFDRSGFVDGADLGVLLGRWGPCGN